jgi:hypothetical protein
MRRQYEFAAHIRSPETRPAPADVEDRRMAIYRELFYNNVEGFLCNSFPVLRKLMNDQQWHALARDFLARHHCHSPLFLEIPREFLNYLEQERGERPGDPPFLSELAHYEWIELALSVAESGEPEAADANGDLLANAPVLSALAWPLSYRYPVHRISPEFQPQSPGEQATFLLVYRDQNDEVGFIELNPVSARLFSLLQAHPGQSGGEALGIIAAELEHPQPQTVIEGGHQILEQWRQRGIILGTRR